ncbi:uncharacterized protein [Onthophagus taurus]|uniref:uncharacterized protein isoform X2 n=1 Tax=Onthophagus taurus TaxID=166361 RepID=UPI0039BDCFAE
MRIRHKTWSHLIKNVNKNTDVCTGAIVTSTIIATSGGCCHSARSISIKAFYNYTIKKWMQTRTVFSTSVLARQDNTLPMDYLCIMKLETELDLNKRTNKIEFYNDSLTQDHVVDIIAILYLKEQDKYKVVCHVAEIERNQSCSEYYRENFDNSSWHPCFTNAFLKTQSCLGVDGAVIQYDNKMIGLLKHFLENCSTAKYGFIHMFSANAEFIKMIITEGKYKRHH